MKTKIYNCRRIIAVTGAALLALSILSTTTKAHHLNKEQLNKISGATTEFKYDNLNILKPDFAKIPITVNPINNQDIFNNTVTFGITEDNGTVRMVIGKSKRKKETPVLYYSFSKDGGLHWSALQKLPVGDYPPHQLNRMRDPRIAVYGKHVMVVWNAAGSGIWGSGPIATAISSNGGKTWHAGPVLGRKDDNIGHRFPAVTADKDGFHVVWINAVGKLSGMNMAHYKHSAYDGSDNSKNQTGQQNSGNHQKYDRSLRYARLPYGGKNWEDISIIDSTSCACCWNRMYAGDGGKLIAVYRNKDPRDISLAISNNGGKSWKKTIDPGSFGWHYNVCPENGGALALIKNSANLTTMLLTGWTGADKKVGAHVVRSSNSGKTWDKPVALNASGQTGWHSDVAILQNGKAVVVFDEIVNDNVQVFAITSTDSGKNWSEPIRLSSKKIHASYPRVIAVNGQFLVLWTSRTKNSSPSVAFRQITF